MTKDEVLTMLAFHIGVRYGISAQQLVGEITGKPSTPSAERRLRACITELRLDGQHVCGHPKTGYFMAANAAELDDTCRHLVNRGATGFREVAAMKRISMPDLYGQFKIPT